MPSKQQLQAQILLDRGVKLDNSTGRGRITEDTAEKTPLMLLLEQKMNTKIIDILKYSMSSRELAKQLSLVAQISISYGTIVPWRKSFGITRQRVN